MNVILSRIGWIKKANRGGWQLTESGKRLGGSQFTHKTSRRTYVLWPEKIADSPILVHAVLQSGGTVPPRQRNKPIKNISSPQFRATDGHFVRSRAELIIDNWLYSRGIAHEYERPLPFNDTQQCDFNIKRGKGVYIEFWGYNSDPQCLSRKRQKKQSCHVHSLQLIELDEDQLSDLDLVLSRKLRAFGIRRE